MGTAYSDRFSRATGAAAIDHTITTTGTIELKEVRLHLSAAGGAVENFVVQIDGSATAAVYDTVLAKQDMNTATDYIFRPTPNLMIDGGDQLTFAWTNTGTKTWGLEVIYKDGSGADALALSG